MIKKQTWMAILATVVLLAGVGCGDSPEEIDPDKGGGTEQEGPEKPEPEKPEPAPAFVLMLSEAEAMNFRISVESDDPQRNYFVGITTRADFDRLKTAQAGAETLVELEKGYGTIDWTTPDDQLIYRGNKTIDAGRIWSLKPKSDYAVVVFGVGAEGAITTDVFHDFISTTAVMPSQNRLSVSVAPESANVSVTTTNADPYFLDCIATSRIEGYPTDKLAEFLIGSYGSAISECIEPGDVTRDFTRLLEEDTDYCAVAFGYLGGYPTTDIVVVPFHTPGGELKPQDCTFSSTVADITLQGATITIKPSNPATPYFWQVYNTTLIESYRKGAGVAQLMADGLAIIAEALSGQAGIEITPEKAAGMVTKTGNDSFVYTTLDPATEYCVMAVGLDNKARQTTEVYISQPFKTLAPGGDVFAPMECTITVNGMTDDGLSVTVSPADKQMTYVGMAGEAEYYAEFASDAEYLTDDLLLWTEMAAGEQMSLVELLTEYGFFLQGDQTYIFPENFTPGNLYLAYTYGLNQQGEVTAGMQKTFFTIDEQGKAHPAAAPAMSNVRKLHRSDLRLAAYSYIPDATRPASPFLNAWTNIAPKRTVGLFE